MRIAGVVAFAFVYAFALFVAIAIIVPMYYAAKEFGAVGIAVWYAFTAATSLFMARPLLRIWFPNALLILDDDFTFVAVEWILRLSLILILLGAAALPLLFLYAIPISLAAFLGAGLLFLLCFIALVFELPEGVAKDL